MSCLKRLQRFFAGMVVVTFFVTNTLTPAPIAYAMPTGRQAANVESPAFISSFKIPAEFGKVTDIIPASSTYDMRNATYASPVLIHIQEAHANYDAQTNIKNILQALTKDYGVKLILVEGAANKLQPGLFNFFPKDKELNGAITDSLMKAGQLTGAEVFLINDLGERNVSRSSFPEKRGEAAEAYGIENAAAYAKDREAYRNVYEGRKLAESFLDAFYRQWQKFADRALNKPLREFLGRETDFEEERLPLQDWMEILKTVAAKHLTSSVIPAKAGIQTGPASQVKAFGDDQARYRGMTNEPLDLEDVRAQVEWPVLARYFRLKKIDPQIDSAKARKEQEAFLADLRMRQIPESLMKEITSLLEHKTSGDLPLYKTRFAFERLMDFLPKDYSFEPYPVFRLYLQQRILLSELQSEQLQEEIKKLTKRIVTSLAKTDDEKRLAGALREYQLLRKLFCLELSREEWEQIQKRKISPEKLLGPRSPLPGPRVKAGSEDRGPRTEIEALFQNALDFYRGAIEREDAMMQNAMKILASHKDKKAVLITGGFHTDGFKEKITASGSSYIGITPNIGEIRAEDQKNYIRALLGQSSVHGPRSTGSALARTGVRDSGTQLLSQSHLGFPAASDGKLVASMGPEYAASRRAEMREVGRQVIAHERPGQFDELWPGYDAQLAKVFGDVGAANKAVRKILADDNIENEFVGTNKRSEVRTGPQEMVFSEYPIELEGPTTLANLMEGIFTQSGKFEGIDLKKVRVVKVELNRLEDVPEALRPHGGKRFDISRGEQAIPIPLADLDDRLRDVLGTVEASLFERVTWEIEADPAPVAPAVSAPGPSGRKKFVVVSSRGAMRRAAPAIAPTPAEPAKAAPRKTSRLKKWVIGLAIANVVLWGSFVITYLLVEKPWRKSPPAKVVPAVQPSTPPTRSEMRNAAEPMNLAAAFEKLQKTAWELVSQDQSVEVSMFLNGEQTTLRRRFRTWPEWGGIRRTVFETMEQLGAGFVFRIAAEPVAEGKQTLKILAEKGVSASRASLKIERTILSQLVRLMARQDELPQKADLVILLGVAGIEEAARLYKEGVAPRILVSGRYHRGVQDFPGKNYGMYRERRVIPEAIGYKQELVEKYGIPEKDILVEDQSRDMEAKAVNSLALLRAKGLVPRTAIVIHASLPTLRAWAKLQEVFRSAGAGTQFYARAPKIPEVPVDVEELDWFRQMVWNQVYKLNHETSEKDVPELPLINRLRDELLLVSGVRFSAPPKGNVSRSPAEGEAARPNGVGRAEIRTTGINRSFEKIKDVAWDLLENRTNFSATLTQGGKTLFSSGPVRDRKTWNEAFRTLQSAMLPLDGENDFSIELASPSEGLELRVVAHKLRSESREPAAARDIIPAMKEILNVLHGSKERITKDNVADLSIKLERLGGHLERLFRQEGNPRELLEEFIVIQLIVWRIKMAVQRWGEEQKKHAVDISPNLDLLFETFAEKIGGSRGALSSNVAELLVNKLGLGTAMMDLRGDRDEVPVISTFQEDDFRDGFVRNIKRFGMDLTRCGIIIFFSPAFAQRVRAELVAWEPVIEGVAVSPEIAVEKILFQILARLKTRDGLGHMVAEGTTLRIKTPVKATPAQVLRNLEFRTGPSAFGAASLTNGQIIRNINNIMFAPASRSEMRDAAKSQGTGFGSDFRGFYNILNFLSDIVRDLVEGFRRYVRKASFSQKTGWVVLGKDIRSRIFEAAGYAAEKAGKKDRGSFRRDQFAVLFEKSSHAQGGSSVILDAADGEFKGEEQEHLAEFLEGLQLKTEESYRIFWRERVRRVNNLSALMIRPVVSEKERPGDERPKTRVIASGAFLPRSEARLPAGQAGEASRYQQVWVDWVLRAADRAKNAGRIEDETSLRNLAGILPSIPEETTDEYTRSLAIHFLLERHPGAEEILSKEPMPRYFPEAVSVRSEVRGGMVTDAGLTADLAWKILCNMSGGQTALQIHGYVTPADLRRGLEELKGTLGLDREIPDAELDKALKELSELSPDGQAGRGYFRAVNGGKDGTHYHFTIPGRAYFLTAARDLKTQVRPAGVREKSSSVLPAVIRPIDVAPLPREKALPATINTALMAAAKAGPESLVTTTLKDGKLTKALLATQIWGDKNSLRETLTNVAFGQPNDATVKSARELVAVIAARNPDSAAAKVVANVLMDRRLDAPRFMEIADELLRRTDPDLAENLEGLLKGSRPVQLQSFQWLFDRMLREAEEAAGDPENITQHLLGARIILKQINRVVSDLNRKEWTALRLHILIRFAERLSAEARVEDKPLMALFLALYPDTARDFLLAVDTNFAALSEVLSDREIESLMAQYGGFDQFSQAIETLLSFACCAWPDWYFDYLKTRYAHTSVPIKASYLAAMRYGIITHANRKDAVRTADTKAEIVPERLRFVLESAVALANEQGPAVQRRVKMVLSGFGEAFIAYIGEGNHYATYTDTQRALLTEVLLDLATGGMIRDGRKKVLPFILQEISREKNESIQEKILFADYFTSEVLETLTAEQGAALRRCIISGYPRFSKNDILEKKYVLIMTFFGPASVADCFEYFRQRVNLDYDLALGVLKLGALVASRYEAKKPEDAVKLREMTATIVRHALAATDDKAAAIRDLYALHEKISQLYKDQEGLDAQEKDLLPTQHAINQKVAELGNEGKNLIREIKDEEREKQFLEAAQRTGNLLLQDMERYLTFWEILAQIKRDLKKFFRRPVSRTANTPGTFSKEDLMQQASLFARGSVKEVAKIRGLWDETEEDAGKTGKKTDDSKKKPVIKPEFSVWQLFRDVKKCRQGLEDFAREIVKLEMGIVARRKHQQKIKSELEDMIAQQIAIGEDYAAIHERSATIQKTLAWAEGEGMERAKKNQAETFRVAKDMFGILRLFLSGPSADAETVRKSYRAFTTEDGECLAVFFALAADPRFATALSYDELKSKLAARIEYQAAHGIFLEELQGEVEQLRVLAEHGVLLPDSTEDPVFQAIFSNLGRRLSQPDPSQVMAELSLQLTRARASHSTIAGAALKHLLTVTEVGETLDETIQEFIENKFAGYEDVISKLLWLYKIFKENFGAKAAVEAIFMRFADPSGHYYRPASEEKIEKPRTRLQVAERAYQPFFHATAELKVAVYEIRKKMLETDEGYGWTSATNDAALFYLADIFRNPATSPEVKKATGDLMHEKIFLPWVQTWKKEMQIGGKKEGQVTAPSVGVWAALGAMAAYLENAPKVTTANLDDAIGEFVPQQIAFLSYLFAKRINEISGSLNKQESEQSLELLERMQVLIGEDISFVEKDSEEVLVFVAIQEAIMKLQKQLGRYKEPTPRALPGGRPDLQLPGPALGPLGLGEFAARKLIETDRQADRSEMRSPEVKKAIQLERAAAFLEALPVGQVTPWTDIQVQFPLLRYPDLIPACERLGIEPVLYNKAFALVKNRSETRILATDAAAQAGRFMDKAIQELTAASESPLARKSYALSKAPGDRREYLVSSGMMIRSALRQLEAIRKGDLTAEKLEAFLTSMRGQELPRWVTHPAQNYNNFDLSVPSAFVYLEKALTVLRTGQTVSADHVTEDAISERAQELMQGILDNPTTRIDPKRMRVELNVAASRSEVRAEGNLSAAFERIGNLVYKGLASKRGERFTKITLLVDGQEQSFEAPLTVQDWNGKSMVLYGAMHDLGEDIHFTIQAETGSGENEIKIFAEKRRPERQARLDIPQTARRSETRSTSSGQDRFGQESRSWRDVTPATNIVPVITPLTHDGKIDAIGIKRLVAHLISQGTRAIFVMGHTGEFDKLTNHQRLQAIQLFAAAAAETFGKMIVHANVTGNTEAQTQKNIQEVSSFRGVHALVVCPLYYLADPGQIPDHFRRMATSLPVGVYNNPALSQGKNIPARKLAEIADRIAFVENSGPQHLTEEYFNYGFTVYAGDEFAIDDALILGARGVTSSFGNVSPLPGQLVEEGLEGKNLEEIQERIRSIVPELTAGWTQEIAGLKETLRFLQVIPSSRVAQGTPEMTGAERARVHAFLQSKDASFVAPRPGSVRSEARSAEGKWNRNDFYREVRFEMLDHTGALELWERFFKAREYRKELDGFLVHRDMDGILSLLVRFTNGLRPSSWRSLKVNGIYWSGVIALTFFGARVLGESAVVLGVPSAFLLWIDRLIHAGELRKILATREEFLQRIHSAVRSLSSRSEARFSGRELGEELERMIPSHFSRRREIADIRIALAQSGRLAEASAKASSILKTLGDKDVAFRSVLEDVVSLVPGAGRFETTGEPRPIQMAGRSESRFTAQALVADGSQPVYEFLISHGYTLATLKNKTLRVVIRSRPGKLDMLIGPNPDAAIPALLGPQGVKKISNLVWLEILPREAFGRLETAGEPRRSENRSGREVRIQNEKVRSMLEHENRGGEVLENVRRSMEEGDGAFAFEIYELVENWLRTEPADSALYRSCLWLREQMAPWQEPFAGTRQAGDEKNYVDAALKTAFVIEQAHDPRAGEQRLQEVYKEFFSYAKMPAVAAILALGFAFTSGKTISSRKAKVLKEYAATSAWQEPLTAAVTAVGSIFSNHRAFSHRFSEVLDRFFARGAHKKSAALLTLAFFTQNPQQHKLMIEDVFKEYEALRREGYLEPAAAALTLLFAALGREAMTKASENFQDPKDSISSVRSEMRSWAEENVLDLSEYTVVSRQMEAGLDRAILEKIAKKQSLGRKIASFVAQLTLTGGLGALMHDLFPSWQKNFGEPKSKEMDAFAVNVIYDEIKGQEFVEDLPEEVRNGSKKLGDYLREALEEDKSLRMDLQLNATDDFRRKAEEWTGRTREERYRRELGKARQAVDHPIKIKVYPTKTHFAGMPNFYIEAFFIDESGARIDIFDSVYPDAPHGAPNLWRDVHMAVYRMATERLTKKLQEKGFAKKKLIFVDNEVFVSLPTPEFPEAIHHHINHTVFRPGLYTPDAVSYEMLGYPDVLRPYLVQNGLINMIDGAGLMSQLITGVGIYEHTPVLAEDIMAAWVDKLDGYNSNGMRSTNGALLDQWQSPDLRSLIEDAKKTMDLKPEDDDARLFEKLELPEHQTAKEMFRERLDIIKSLLTGKLLLGLKKEMGFFNWIDKAVREYEAALGITGVNPEKHMQSFEEAVKTALADPTQWVKLTSSREWKTWNEILMKDPIVSNIRRQVSYKGPDKWLGILRGFRQDSPSLQRFKEQGCRVIIGGRLFGTEAQSMFEEIRGLIRELGLEDRMTTIENYNIQAAPDIFQGVAGTVMLSDEFLEASATSMMKALMNSGFLIGVWGGAEPELFTIVEKATGREIDIFKEKTTHDMLVEKLDKGEWSITNGWLVRYAPRSKEWSSQKGGGRRPSASSLEEGLRFLAGAYRDPASRKNMLWNVLKSSPKVDMEKGQARAHMKLWGQSIRRVEEEQKIFASLSFASDKVEEVLSRQFSHTAEFVWQSNGNGPLEVSRSGLLGFIESTRRLRMHGRDGFLSVAYHAARNDIFPHIFRYLEGAEDVFPEFYQKMVDLQARAKDAPDILSNVKIHFEALRLLDRFGVELCGGILKHSVRSPDPAHMKILSDGRVRHNLYFYLTRHGKKLESLNKHIAGFSLEDGGVKYLVTLNLGEKKYPGTDGGEAKAWGHVYGQEAFKDLTGEKDPESATTYQITDGFTGEVFGLGPQKKPYPFWHLAQHGLPVGIPAPDVQVLKLVSTGQSLPEEKKDQLGSLVLGDLAALISGNPLRQHSPRTYWIRTTLTANKPEDIKTRLQTVSGIGREKALEVFGFEGVRPVMAFVTALAPELLEEMKEWDPEVYAALKKIVTDSDLKDLFEKGEVGFQDVSRDTALVISRTLTEEKDGVKRTRHVVIPVHFPKYPYNKEEGKVWFGIGSIATLGLSPEMIYQVKDHTAGVTYDRKHTLASLQKEGWRVGIPVVKRKDPAEIQQPGWRFQVLEMVPVGVNRLETQEESGTVLHREHPEGTRTVPEVGRSETRQIQVVGDIGVIEDETQSGIVAEMNVPFGQHLVHFTYDAAQSDFISQVVFDLLLWVKKYEGENIVFKAGPRFGKIIFTLDEESKITNFKKVEWKPMGLPKAARPPEDNQFLAAVLAWCQGMVGNALTEGNVGHDPEETLENYAAQASLLKPESTVSLAVLKAAPVASPGVAGTESEVSPVVTTPTELVASPAVSKPVPAAQPVDPVIAQAQKAGFLPGTMLELDLKNSKTLPGSFTLEELPGKLEPRETDFDAFGFGDPAPDQNRNRVWGSIVFKHGKGEKGEWLKSRLRQIYPAGDQEPHFQITIARYKVGTMNSGTMAFIAPVPAPVRSEVRLPDKIPAAQKLRNLSKGKHAPLIAAAVLGVAVFIPAIFLMDGFTKLFAMIFFIVNPVGSAVTFLYMTRDLDAVKQSSLKRNSMITATLFGVTFLFAGKWLFGLMGITLGTFMVAGGALLFLFMVKALMFPGNEKHPDPSKLGAVPLGVPLTVGPATITALMLLRGQHGWLVPLTAFLANMLLTAALFHYSEKVNKVLPPERARILGQVFNLLLAALGATLIFKGLITVREEINTGVLKPMSQIVQPADRSEMRNERSKESVISLQAVKPSDELPEAMIQRANMLVTMISGWLRQRYLSPQQKQQLESARQTAQKLWKDMGDYPEDAVLREKFGVARSALAKATASVGLRETFGPATSPARRRSEARLPADVSVARALTKDQVRTVDQGEWFSESVVFSHKVRKNLVRVIRGALAEKKPVFLAAVSSNSKEQDDLLNMFGFVTVQSRADAERAFIAGLPARLRSDSAVIPVAQGNQVSFSFSNGETVALVLSKGPSVKTFLEWVAGQLSANQRQVGVDSFAGMIAKGRFSLRDRLPLIFTLVDAAVLAQETGVESAAVQKAVVTQEEYDALPEKKSSESVRPAAVLALKNEKTQANLQRVRERLGRFSIEFARLRQGPASSEALQALIDHVTSAEQILKDFLIEAKIRKILGSQQEIRRLVSQDPRMKDVSLAPEMVEKFFGAQAGQIAREAVKSQYKNAALGYDVLQAVLFGMDRIEKRIVALQSAKKVRAGDLAALIQQIADLSKMVEIYFGFLVGVVKENPGVTVPEDITNRLWVLMASLGAVNKAAPLLLGFAETRNPGRENEGRRLEYLGENTEIPQWEQPLSGESAEKAAEVLGELKEFFIRIASELPASQPASYIPVLTDILNGFAAEAEALRVKRPLIPVESLTLCSRAYEEFNKIGGLLTHYQHPYAQLLTAKFPEGAALENRIRGLVTEAEAGLGAASRSEVRLAAAVAASPLVVPLPQNSMSYVAGRMSTDDIRYTIYDIRTFVAENVRRGGGTEQGLRGVTEKIMDGIIPLLAHTLGAAELLIPVVARIPAVQKIHAVAAKRVLGLAPDAGYGFILGEDLALGEGKGMLALAKTVFQGSSFAILVKDLGRVPDVEKLILREGLQDRVFVITNAKLARARISKPGTSIKGMISSDELMLAEELKAEVKDLIVMDRGMQRRFLNAAGQLFQSLADKIAAQFSLLRSA